MKSEMDVSRARIGVVGAGNWGTAIANLLGNKGFKVDFWVFEKEVKEQIEEFRENRIFLPGITLSSNIFPSKLHHSLQLLRSVVRDIPLLWLSYFLEYHVFQIVCHLHQDNTKLLFPTN